MSTRALPRTSFGSAGRRMAGDDEVEMDTTDDERQKDAEAAPEDFWTPTPSRYDVPHPAARQTAARASATPQDEPEKPRATTKPPAKKKDERDRKPLPGTRHVFLRDVSEDLLARIKAVAKQEGRTLPKQLLRILSDYADSL